MWYFGSGETCDQIIEAIGRMKHLSQSTNVLGSENSRDSPYSGSLLSSNRWNHPIPTNLFTRASQSRNDIFPSEEVNLWPHDEEKDTLSWGTHDEFSTWKASSLLDLEQSSNISNMSSNREYRSPQGLVQSGMSREESKSYSSSGFGIVRPKSQIEPQDPDEPLIVAEGPGSISSRAYAEGPGHDSLTSRPYPQGPASEQLTSQPYPQGPASEPLTSQPYAQGPASEPLSSQTYAEGPGSESFSPLFAQGPASEPLPLPAYAQGNIPQGSGKLKLTTRRYPESMIVAQGPELEPFLSPGYPPGPRSDKWPPFYAQGPESKPNMEGPNSYSEPAFAQSGTRRSFWPSGSPFVNQLDDASNSVTSGMTNKEPRMTFGDKNTTTNISEINPNSPTMKPEPLAFSDHCFLPSDSPFASDVSSTTYSSFSRSSNGSYPHLSSISVGTDEMDLKHPPFNPIKSQYKPNGSLTVHSTPCPLYSDLLTNNSGVRLSIGHNHEMVEFILAFHYEDLLNELQKNNIQVSSYYLNNHGFFLVVPQRSPDVDMDRIIRQVMEQHLVGIMKTQRIPMPLDDEHFVNYLLYVTENSHRYP